MLECISFTNIGKAVMKKYSNKEIGEAKRQLVLDLVECIKEMSRKLMDGSPYVNTEVVQSLTSYAQIRAIDLTREGIDWRNHTVRSKHFKGKLGDLYDKFAPYQSKSLKTV